MTKGKKIVCTALSCLLMFGGVYGCSDDSETTAEVNASVWGTYGTVKVTQNVKESVPYAKLPPSVNIQMMKNETEGSQIIVTTGDSPVAKYSLQTSDLTDAKGNVIEKSAISVYHQKYLEVMKKTDILNQEYLVGDRVPDMLLPLDIAAEYGENTIAANENQGITIEVKSTSETVPGTYTGKFVLDLDGKKTDIPVTVEVWDIEYEGRRTFQSSFLLYRSSLVKGEYEVSDELTNRYIEFFLDYKVNSYVVQDSYSTAEFVAEAERFFDNDNYNSICIPNDMSGAGYTATSGKADAIINYIVAAAQASTPEKPYVDYLYIYPSYYDEADAWPEKQADMERVFAVGGEWDKTLLRALEKIRETAEYQGFTEEFKAHVDEVILNIPAVIPNTTFLENWVQNQSTTFCPVLNLLNNNAQVNQYHDFAETNQNGNLWGYTCVGPTYPHPTFHVDDYNLGTRVSGWMSKKFNLDGYLYWASNLYEATGYDLNRDIDPYETAERAGYCAGDGFLVYPGAYYGSEYPFASIRLQAWRDGMDDYDMLCVYERLLNEKAAEYGVSVSFEDCVNDLYDSLFSGTEYYTDDAIVLAVREELATRILALQSEDGIVAVPSKGKITVYSAKPSLTVDGTAMNGVASGSGYQYDVANDNASAKTVEIKTENGTYAYVVKGKAQVVDFAASSLRTTEKSSATVENGKANVTIVSEYRGKDGVINNATESFSPYVEFDVSSLSGASTLNFTFENTGSEHATFTVNFVTADGEAKEFSTGFVKAGNTRQFRFDIDGRAFSASDLSSVVAIRISFANVNTGATSLAPTKTFSVSDFWCELN